MLPYYYSVVLIGYPPKGLSLRNSGASLTELGIKSGDSLIVEELSPQAVSETRHLSPPYKKESPPHKKEAPIPKISRRFVNVSNAIKRIINSVYYTITVWCQCLVQKIW